jgi:hypothetical protein
MDNQFLGEIEKALSVGAWNYTVFLRFYEIPLPKQAEKEAIIQALLASKATLESIEEITKSSVWPAIKSRLLYAGTDGAGPAASTINSAQMSELMIILEDEVRKLVDKAVTIDSFELQEGHPAYPVFWDFAFLFSGEASASLLIGSSSD